MEPILLAGFPQGSPLGLVAAFEWLGQPFRISRLKMPDDMLSDGYARLNGRRETPVLIKPDGNPLTETMAIALWIEARDHERRESFAPDTHQADLLRQYVAFLNSGFTTSFAPFWVALEAPDLTDGDRESLRKAGRAGVAKRHWVAFAREFHKAIDDAGYPRIKALKARLEADPTVRFAHRIEDGEDAPGSDAMKGLVRLHEVIERFGKKP